MKRLSICAPLFIAAALAASGCVYIEDGADWSPDERVDIEPFESFTLSGSGDVRIWVCDCSAAVFVDGDDDIEPPYSGDGSLSIDSGDEVVWGTSGDLLLRTPSLRSVTLNGSGSISVYGVLASDFTANNNGSGEIELYGDARRATLWSTGSGDIEAAELSTKIAEARTTGSGDIEICAFERAVAVVEGSGNIDVECSPEDVESSVLGSGDVEVD